MGSAMPAYRNEYAVPDPEAPKAHDPAALFERPAARLTARELLPMAAILLLVSALAAVIIVYLTAFGRLTAQGAREQQLDRQISQLRGFNAGLVGDVARLQRRDRLEREARRLGLAPLEPDRTERLEVPAGALDPVQPAAPRRQAAAPAYDRVAMGRAAPN